MNCFAIGDRVELKSCPGVHGTVTGFKRGSVQVQFDDFTNEPAKALRQASLQIAERREAVTVGRTG
jgi:hypothetical protein